MKCSLKKNSRCRILLSLLMVFLGGWFWEEYYLWQNDKSMFKFVDKINKKDYFHLKRYRYKSDYDEFRDTLKERGLFYNTIYTKLIRSKSKKVVGFLFSNGKGRESYYDKKGNRMGYKTQNDEFFNNRDHPTTWKEILSAIIRSNKNRKHY